ncbi:pyrroline-5-carboxylate reductase [Acetobacter orleanensis]|uniref:Pyrroline-5-carboxylate reductase n=1 Tax=Acetobacter orleanensis TaxID=104099 RepID=A0A4Y3TLD6_9PROT|nr:pyrroline-5-carboxylate reductase [Acetobacter orleanensis]GAN67566.1 pyrroline-5-carboxylate reductase [Acetobacter orleanensis JCM 7639]GEB82574.1 pyrroline-5-carboxylate reductase [Acetobacter orleanensis]
MAAQTTPLPSVLLVGCGQMGSSMLEGWLAHGLKPSVVLDRHDRALPAPHKLAATLDAVPAEFQPDIIILAVKPQKADEVLGALAQRFPNATLLTVMAGRTVASLTACYTHSNPKAQPVIIRAMPNTPCAIGAGMSGLYAPPNATEEQKAQCDALLRAVGDTVWVAQEEQMDSVTALSGSGPAYIFLLAELLEKAGVEQGLPAETARTLARKTIYGAGALLNQSPVDAEELRRRVTSPGGTTAEALKIFMAPDAWPATVPQAVAAAARRAKELST